MEVIFIIQIFNLILLGYVSISMITGTRIVRLQHYLEVNTTCLSCAEKCFFFLLFFIKLVFIMEDNLFWSISIILV